MSARVVFLVEILALDYRELYDLERYLLDKVTARWHRSGQLSPFDFWCILIWKANRAKNKTKARLQELAEGSFSGAVRKLANDLRAAQGPESRLSVLMVKWRFRLPTAPAVLTILYPDTFTVYDERVCDVLKSFTELRHRKYSKKLWSDYLKYKRAVEHAAPQRLILRDKDRYLWGKSLYDDIKAQSA